MGQSTICPSSPETAQNLAFFGPIRSCAIRSRRHRGIMRFSAMRPAARPPSITAFLHPQPLTILTWASHILTSGSSGCLLRPRRIRGASLANHQRYPLVASLLSRMFGQHLRLLKLSANCPGARSRRCRCSGVGNIRAGLWLHGLFLKSATKITPATGCGSRASSGTATEGTLGCRYAIAQHYDEPHPAQVPATRNSIHTLTLGGVRY